MDADVAQQISFVNLCRAMNTLPSAGGLLDQHTFHVAMFQAVFQGEQAREAFEEQKKRKGSRAS